MAVISRQNCAGLSDPGRKRENNEDRFHADPERGIFFVIDGVGGQAAGEKAADTAYGLLRARLERPTGSPTERVREAITIANNEIFRLAEMNEEWRGMACVLTVAVLEGGELTIGQVGDSRLYVIEPGEIRKLTHDHSPVGEREDRGEIDEIAAMRHPRRNEVYRDVGSEEHSPDDPDFIEISTAEFPSSAALLLCSDGLSDLITSIQILSIAEQGAGDPVAVTQALIDAANNAGGKDNVTVVYVEGDRFAPSVRRRSSATRKVPVPPRSFAGEMLGSRWLFLLAGLLLGSALAVFTFKPYWRITPEGQKLGFGAIRDQRIWRVNSDLAAAIQNARSGDTVIVAPGQYHEQLVLKDGVNVISELPRQAVIRASGIAVQANEVRSGRFEGFRITGEEQNNLAVGIQLNDSNIEVADNEVTNATTAAVECLGESTGVFRANALYGNPGAGIIVRDAARTRFVHNTITGNGQSGKRPGIEILGAAQPVLTGNMIWNNAGEPVFAPPQFKTEEVLKQNFIAHPAGGPGARQIPTEQNNSPDPDRQAKTEAKHAISMHPREFGKYKIVKLLPLGGMGRVYLAVDPETDEKVALKLIDQGPDPDRQEIVEAERRGAILQSRLCGLDHRIVRVLAYGDDDGYFFIEMEYVEGQDLTEILRNAPLGVPFAARIGRDLCEVLQHAHTFSAEIEGHQYHGIVHGDIKPRNIRITPDGQVKVLDFGIAKALSLTRKFTTNLFGSSQYSSPERLNTGDVDIASDLWSVGVVLYEIVTGKPYFPGEPSARLEQAIRGYSVMRPLPESLPSPFAAILRKSLAVDPAQRYQSAQSFAADLNAFLEGKPTAAEASDDDTEATRRLTIGGAEEIDEAATRRTSARAGVRASPPPARPVKANARREKTPLTPRQRQIRFFVGLAAFVALVLLAFHEFNTWRTGAQLAREVESERLTDMDAAWQRYDALQKTSFAPWVLSGPRNAIQARLNSVADAVINEYARSDAPSITEKEWIKAHDLLARALDIDPHDRTVRGKLYLTDGHLSRIRGTARGDSKLLNDARGRFEQAAELMPKSPDPYLGLARLYVYSLRDVDRAEDALKAAEKRGHEMGRRERAQLADGYRDRGERLMKEGIRAAGLPEEKDLLKRAEKDLKAAEEIYRDIVPYGNSSTSLRRVLENRAVIDARRDAMKDGIWPWR